MIIKYLIPVIICVITIAHAEQSDSLATDSIPPILEAPIESQTSSTAPDTVALNSPSQTPVATTLENQPSADTSINIMEEFEIFGDDDQSSIFILGFDDSELDKVVQEQIMLRSFSKDLYFMQNIDREEFESQRNLRSNIYSEFNHSDFTTPDEGSEEPTIEQHR
ncbi:MAG: hypothetical protein OCC49_12110 [Fibrobacterales bacterium]